MGFVLVNSQSGSRSRATSVSIPVANSLKLNFIPSTSCNSTLARNPKYTFRFTISCCWSKRIIISRKRLDCYAQTMSSNANTDVEMTPLVHQHQQHHEPLPPLSQGIHYHINRMSKWLTIVMVGVVVLCKHDTEVLWAVIGSVLNTANSKFLKSIIKHERPPTALAFKSDSGMPSSHAQSFGFIYTYAAIFYFGFRGQISPLFGNSSANKRMGNYNEIKKFHESNFSAKLFWRSFGEKYNTVSNKVIGWQGLNILSIGGGLMIITSGAYLTWLRVLQGLHSCNQVLVGASLGSISALLWCWLWNAVVARIVTAHLWFRITLYCVSVISSVGFFVKIFQSWTSNDL